MRLLTARDDIFRDFVYPAAMTPETLLREWLSLRYWLLKCVLPVAIALTGLLLALRFVFKDPQSLDHNSLIVAFFAVYFIVVRGGHIVMIRSMHFDLLRTYGDDYRNALGYLPMGQMKRRKDRPLPGGRVRRSRG